MRILKLKDSDAARRCHASSLCAFLHNARARHLHDCPPVRAGDLVGYTDVGYEGTSGLFTKIAIAETACYRRCAYADSG